MQRAFPTHFMLHFNINHPSSKWPLSLISLTTSLYAVIFNHVQSIFPSHVIFLFDLNCAVTTTHWIAWYHITKNITMPHKLNQLPVYISCHNATYPTTFSLRQLTTHLIRPDPTGLARVLEFSRDLNVLQLAHGDDVSYHLSCTILTHWALPATNNSLAAAKGATNPCFQGPLNLNLCAMGDDNPWKRVTMRNCRWFGCLWSQIIHVV